MTQDGRFLPVVRISQEDKTRRRSPTAPVTPGRKPGCIQYAIQYLLRYGIGAILAYAPARLD
jgi:hypothetical protein